MRKILLILSLFISLAGFSQDTKPLTNFVAIPANTYSFGYYKTDSTVWIWKGTVLGWTQLANNRDGWYAKTLVGTDTIIIRIAPKDTLNLAKYMLHNDSIDITGYFTNAKGLLKVDKNPPITPATHTKITYDAKGLVTGGLDVTTAGIPDTVGKRYITDEQISALHPAVTLATNSGLTLSTQTLAMGTPSTLSGSTTNTVTTNTHTHAITGFQPTITPAALTKTDDTNVTLTLSGSPSTSLLNAAGITVGWTGTLADSRITSASTWNAKQTALNGTGYLYFTGTTPSYRNESYSLTNHTHSGVDFSLLNDQWFLGHDYAGNLTNIFKISKDNLTEFAHQVAIDKLYHVLNAGFGDVARIPISAMSPYGAEHGFGFSIGNNRILKISGISDGVGGLQDTLVTIDAMLKITDKPVNGYFLKCIDATGLAKWMPITGTGGYKGTWSATDNSPEISNGGSFLAGDWYRCVVSGTWNSIAFNVNDDVYYNGTIWQRVPSIGFTLQTATPTVLGGIKIGNGITMTGDVASVKTDYVENATHTGDATGSTALTLATVNSNIGTYNNITINGKGLATAGSNIAYWYSSSHPTTISGYGITDAYPGAGIAVSTGTGWGTSITDNSSHWNTAYSWGNHAGLYSLLNHNHSGVYEVPLTFSTGLTRTGNTITNNITQYTDAMVDARITGKENTITAGTIWQYWRGDKTWQLLPTLTDYSLLNDQWLYSYDYAGNRTPLLKISKDNLLIFAPKVGINSLFHTLNSGITTISRIPLDAGANGTQQGYELWIGNTRAMKLYGIASGGEVDTARAIFHSVSIQNGAALNKIAMSEDSKGKVKWSDTKYLFNLVANRILFASATNEMGQLPLGTAGQILMSGGASAPYWTTPTYPNTAPNGYLMMGNGTNWGASAVPTWNQNTTGTAAGLTAAYINWNATSGGTMILNKPDLTVYKLKTDTTGIDGYTRRDRLATELFKKQNQLNSTGGLAFVKAQGTTITYDLNTYLTAETDPSVYTWAKQSVKPTYTYSEVGAEPAISKSTGYAKWTGSAWSWDNSTFVTGTPWTSMGYLTSLPSHAHGNITNSGAIGSTTGLPIITTTSGVLTVGTFGTGAGTFCVGNDARLSDSRIASDVYTWAKQTVKPSYAWSEISSKPTTVSTWTNDAGYITSASLPTVNNATLTMNVSGPGLSGSQTFTANQAAGATFTVTSNATASNTPSTIVLRDGSGYVSLQGTFCSSDSTLKKNIKALSKIDFYNVSKIDFRKFIFKADNTNHLHFGVIAQEVEKMIPEVVNTNESGKKEVNYPEMLVLIAAQQKEEIKTLKDRVESLEKIVNRLIEIKTKLK
ncbi:MAG: tail fiber domain-containing protein [Methanobacterium sp.]